MRYNTFRIIGYNVQFTTENAVGIRTVSHIPVSEDTKLCQNLNGITLTEAPNTVGVGYT